MLKTAWVFMAYDDEESKYPEHPFHCRVFHNYIEMKNHSASHSDVYKKLCKNYVSTYIKTEL